MQLFDDQMNAQCLDSDPHEYYIFAYEINPNAIDFKKIP